jgi:hypothetical protein
MRPLALKPTNRILYALVGFFYVLLFKSGHQPYRSERHINGDAAGDLQRNWP